MSWVDWIPIVATIKHAVADPKGRNVNDYTCNMERSMCDSEFEAVAIENCKKDITRQMLSFIEDFCGGGLVDQYAAGAVSLTIAAIVASILKRLIAKNAAKAAITTAGGVTVVLAADGIIDLYITIKKVNQIKEAAEDAQKSCCKCR